MSGRRAQHAAKRLVDLTDYNKLVQFICSFTFNPGKLYKVLNLKIVLNTIFLPSQINCLQIFFLTVSLLFNFELL